MRKNDLWLSVLVSWSIHVCKMHVASFFLLINLFHRFSETRMLLIVLANYLHMELILNILLMFFMSFLLI